MKRLLIVALLLSVPLAAQSAPAPATPAPAAAASESSELAVEAAQLADLAVRVRDEIGKMKKFELSVKALQSAMEAEALAKKMRAQSASSTQH